MTAKTEVIKRCLENNINLFYKYDRAAAKNDDYIYYLKAEFDGDELWTLSDVSRVGLWEHAEELLGNSLDDGWIKLV